MSELVSESERIDDVDDDDVRQGGVVVCGNILWLDCSCAVVSGRLLRRQHLGGRATNWGKQSRGLLDELLQTSGRPDWN